MKFLSFHDKSLKNCWSMEWMIWGTLHTSGRWEPMADGAVCSTSSLWKPGWQFTDGSAYQSSDGLTMDLHRSVILVVSSLFLVIICFMSYWFVACRCQISYWSSFLCHYQFSCLSEIMFWTPPSLSQMMKITFFWWSALRVSGGNQVDGLMPARHR